MVAMTLIAREKGLAPSKPGPEAPVCINKELAKLLNVAALEL